MKIGAMTSMKDSGRKASAVDILEDNNPSLRSIHLEEESGLKSKIEGYRRLSAVEWIEEHTEQDELFCKNILTNILEHDIIQV
ncbi:hypothetical protein CS266P2_00032 [Clostridium phage CS266P2]|nr:hypothetical protein CS266P1_00005 [Clostridium phage CS266P1]WAX12160.1 hypothetical protein CS266P2_00032 [Clostridium phage CS266P2]WAX12308.1 hypothetical protein CS266P4_00040 [Clostridium phage CS266P4]